MKTLLVMRHAKSSWTHPDVADHDRPLNRRGKQDAPRMGRLLRQRKLTPEVIVSSTAKRARRTADVVADCCGFNGAVRLERRLYLADPATILEVLRELSNPVGRPLVIGHNPGLEELITKLTGRTEIFPPAALAQIQFSIDSWDALPSSIPGWLVNVWRPKELVADTT